MGWVLGFICIGMGGHSVSPGFRLPEVGQGFCVVLYTEKMFSELRPWDGRRGKEGLLMRRVPTKNWGFPQCHPTAEKPTAVPQFLTCRVGVEEATPRWDYCCWGLICCP